MAEFAKIPLPKYEKSFSLFELIAQGINGNPAPLHHFGGEKEQTEDLLSFLQISLSALADNYGPDQIYLQDLPNSPDLSIMKCRALCSYPGDFPVNSRASRAFEYDTWTFQILYIESFQYKIGEPLLASKKYEWDFDKSKRYTLACMKSAIEWDPSFIYVDQKKNPETEILHNNQSPSYSQILLNSNIFALEAAKMQQSLFCKKQSCVSAKDTNIEFLKNFAAKLNFHHGQLAQVEKIRKEQEEALSVFRSQSEVLNAEWTDQISDQRI